MWLDSLTSKGAEIILYRPDLIYEKNVKFCWLNYAKK